MLEVSEKEYDGDEYERTTCPELIIISSCNCTSVAHPLSYTLQVLRHAKPISVTGCSAVPQFMSLRSVLPSLSLNSHSQGLSFDS